MLRFAAYAWEKGNAKQVAYRARDGHIHELVVVRGGSWTHNNLTGDPRFGLTGVPRPDPDTGFAGYEWDAGGTKQVVYTTSDGHIQELSASVDRGWGHTDLTIKA